jgi:serine O-acetyltransferase
MNERHEALIRSILRTYDDSAYRGIHHLGQCSLPSYREIVEIVKDLYELTYPGYGRHQKLSEINALYHVGHLVDDLSHRLNEQIRRALLSTQDCSEKFAVRNSADLALSFLEKIPRVREFMATDVQAALTAIRLPRTPAKSCSAIQAFPPSRCSGSPMKCMRSVSR